MKDVFIELHARSAFSFLRGASNPEDLASSCARRGVGAMALCDRDGVYGSPRFHAAARKEGIRALIGAELTMEDGSVVPVLAASRRGYRNLCGVLTEAKLRAPKGEGRLRWKELEERAEGLIALTGDEEGPVLRGWRERGQRGVEAAIRRLEQVFSKEDIHVELQRHRVRGEEQPGRMLIDLARARGLPLVATNGVCQAVPEERAVLDVFTCLRHKTTLDGAGRLLSRNAERHVKGFGEMAELFADIPEAVSNTARVAERLAFSLEDLGYSFPEYPMATGELAGSFLRERVWEGARNRYGGNPGAAVRAQLEKELALIERLGFCGYFLIVWDIVNFARSRNIMAQGRGSAANSAVCYCLGITAVDPVKERLLFERFLSEGRKSWPDIDIDLPSGKRREEVIQEVYRRYGRRGAAMTANVITYRGRSAAREIGKVLRFPEEITERFSRLYANGDFPHTIDLKTQLRQAGVPESHPRAAAMVSLYRMIYGLPRHLGQHSGGMIICQGRLDTIVPLENASMPGRSVAQWDKDDCEDLGIIKVDLLGLGMMSVMQDALELSAQRGRPVDLAHIPKDDPATFELMQKADTVGVFQIESRAQMATLPRMKPKTFYDVVIEVGIIRPGPIQGKMVHPYLARRAGKAPVRYPDERLKPVLERTLGIALFQEQVLKMAMVMADFSGSEAEELRRALSFYRSGEKLDPVKAKLRVAMEKKGVAPEVIQEIIDSVSSFALYAFPESHAISFALLTYGSAYLKVHRGAEFFAALLNNQPMGFYSPATLIQDARRRGIRVCPVCAVASEWECIVESDTAIRLGFCMVRGMRARAGRGLVSERRVRPFESIEDLRLRSGLNRDELRKLASLGALNALAEHRRDALWQVEEPWEQGELFSGEGQGSIGKCLDPEHESRRSLEPECPLEAMSDLERLRADYRGMGATTGAHPMRSLRANLPDVWPASMLPHGREGQRVTIAGSVICRQRPGTAKGFVFISLEDETGIANAVATPAFFEKNRLIITQEPALKITGLLQTREGVICVKAEKVEVLTGAGGVPAAESHDFR